MTKGELNTHIEKRYSECCKRSQGLSYGSFYDGYVDCYCEQQKQIEKLEQQIEKMKCCENCMFENIPKVLLPCHICVAKSNWKLKEIKEK